MTARALSAHSRRHRSHFACRASILTEVRGGGTHATSFFALLFELREAAFGEVLLWLDSIEKFALAELGIRIEVHPSNDRNQEGIASIDAAFDEESLQIARVNKAKVAVIDILVAGLNIEVIAGGQVRLAHLTLPAKGKLLLDELSKTALYIVG